MTIDWILSQFNEGREEAIKKYNDFVYGGLKEGSSRGALKGQIFLGGDSFVERFEGLLREREKIKEIPRIQRYATRPSLERLLNEETLEEKGKKEEAIFKAHLHYGYTLREISEHLGVHYATISRAIKRVEEKDKK